MKTTTKILISLMLLAIALPLWLVGFEQIRRYGIIGCFNPIAQAFGLPLIPIAIIALSITITMCAIFSWYAVRISRRS